MTGAAGIGGVRVRVEDGLVRRSFGALDALGADLTPLFREVGARVVSSTQLRFEAGRAPDGTPWKPSLRARTEAGQTLQQNGDLKRSVVYAAEPRRAVVGTNVRYAAVHQFGATVRAKKGRFLRFQIGKRTVFKPMVVIPARPFLGISASDLTAIQAIVARRVAAAVRGGASA